MRNGTKRRTSLLLALVMVCSLLVTPAAAEGNTITVTVTSSGSLKHIFANNPANTNAESLKNHVANSYTFTGTYTYNGSTVTVPITAAWSDPEFENGNSKSFSPQGFQGWLHGSAQYYYPATFSTSAVPPSGYTFQFTSGWRSSNFLVAAVMATQTFDTPYKTVDRAVIQGDAFQLSGLGLPETVNVTYAAYREDAPGGFNPDTAVGKLVQDDGQYRITGWKMGDEDLTVETLRAAAGDSGYQDLKLTPVYADSGDNAVPVWATLEEKPQFTLTVGPGESAEITVTPPDDIIYGSALGEPKATATVGGVPLTDATFTYRYTGRYHANQYSDGTLYDSEEKPTQAGEYQVIATLIHDTCSGKSTSATSFTISPKPVTITDITIEDKVYDGYLSAEMKSAVINGKEDGDTLNVSISAYFQNKDVGTNKRAIIYYSESYLYGEDSLNYTIDERNSQNDVYANINPKKLGVNDAQFEVTKKYDGTSDPGEKSGWLGVSGACREDTVHIDNDKVTVGSYDTPAVGRDKTVTLSNITLFGDDKVNYTIDPTYEFKRAEITSGRSKPVLGTDFTVDIPNPTYDGQPHPAAVTPKSEGLGAYTVTYGKWHGSYAEYPSEEPPVKAGEYVVYVSFAEGEKFAYADKLEAGRLVIGKASGEATANVTLGAGETRTFYLSSLFSSSEYDEYGGNIKIKESFTKGGTTAFNQVTGNTGYGYIEVSAKLVNADKSEDFTLKLTTENYDPLTVTVTVEVKKCDLTFTPPKVTVKDPGTFPKGTPLKEILTLSGGSAWLNRTEIKGNYDLKEPDKECEPGTYTNHRFEVVFTSNDGQHTGETQVLASFTIMDYTSAFSPYYITIYANSKYNQSAEALLKLVGERKGSYKDDKGTYAATWSAASDNLAFAPKGYVDNLWYKYVADVQGRSEKPEAYVRVVPVNATPWQLNSGSIKTMKAAEVTALTEENWKDTLGLPAKVIFKNEPAEEVKFIEKEDEFLSSDQQKGYEITGWKLDGRDLTLAALKAKADSAADLDVTVELTPVYTHDAWAAVQGSTPTFKLTITPKTPVSVTWNTPQSFDYGTTLGELLELWESDHQKGCDPPEQKEISSGGTDENGTWQYFYYSSDGTRLSGEPKDAGTYKAQAVLVSDTHSGASELKEFTINPRHVKFLTFEEPAGIDNLTYNKRPQTPEYTVKDGETVLGKDRDYTVTYSDNINAGTAKVTFTCTGNYDGEKEVDFTINKLALTENQKPIISGNAAAGQVLSASLDDVDAAELEWAWTVGGTPVKNNTTASYEVQPKDSNKEITVKAKAKTDGNYSGESGASGEKTVAMVKVTGTVTFNALGGPIEVGTKLMPTLTVTPRDARTGGTWSWRVNGTVKAGEKDDSYIVKDGDREIIAVFTPNENYTGSIESAKIEVGKILLGGSVDIRGGNTVGEQLTADTSSMPEPLVFTWLRNNEPIPGANQRTYTVAAADRGKTLSVRVTAEGYTGERVSNSKGIPAVEPSAPAVTVTAGDRKLTIRWSAPADDGGAPIIGYKLTVKEGKEEVLSAALAANVTSYTLENLTNGTEYSISVQAVNSDNNKTSEAGTATGTPRAAGGGNQPGGGDGNKPGGGGSGGGGSGGWNAGGAANPDGSKVTVETKGDGTVVTTVRNSDGSRGVTEIARSGQTTAAVYLPASVAGRAANGGSAVLLPLQDIYASQSIDRAPVVTIDTSGVNGVKVDLPLANKSAGVVAVRVMADGTEQIIQRTIPTRNGAALLVNSGDTIKLLDNSMSFADTRGHWAADAVDFVSARGLFRGTAPNTFSPNARMTRGMLVTVLARYEGVDTEGGDVWYEKGAAWAMANGLSDGSRMNDNITRQQLTAILYRCAILEGRLSGAGVDLQGYTDVGRVSSYAAEAMSWAVGVGLIRGTTPTTLDPQGSATRGQVAVILMRYAERFGL